MKKILWWLVAGTKGGINRALIIKELHERPFNANQLADRLNLDYKTIRHHLKVLEENKIIKPSGGKYGAMYFLTGDMESEYSVFEEIWALMDEEGG